MVRGGGRGEEEGIRQSSGMHESTGYKIRIPDAKRSAKNGCRQLRVRWLRRWLMELKCRKQLMFFGFQLATMILRTRSNGRIR